MTIGSIHQPFTENNPLFYTDFSGNTYVNYDAVRSNKDGYAKIVGEQNYVSNGVGHNTDLTNLFLESRGSKYKLETKDLSRIINGRNISTDRMEEIISSVKEILSNKKAVLTLSVYDKEDSFIRFLEPVTPATKTWKSFMEKIKIQEPTTWKSLTATGTWGGEGHAVAITGITEDGFIVSSWGKRLLIPFDDLKNSSRFNIYIGEFVENSQN